jgi:anti-sigma-K factor RskA
MNADNPELDALLGAYALDALDDDERARVEAYLSENPQARHEVDELRESAASLALIPVDDPQAPPELWDRIESQINAEPRAFTPLRAKPKRTVSAGLFATVAVAASIAIVLLGVGIVVHRNGSNAGNLAAAFDKAQQAPGARTVSLASTQHADAARVVVLPDGSGYLQNNAMQPLPAGQVYQLWAIGPNGTPVSIGVLGGNPSTAAFHASPDVKTLGITVERSPGVVVPTPPMYASAPVA